MALINELSCNLINIQLVGNKTNIIRSMINDQNLDICMLTETWLSNNVSDSSKINEMTPKLYNFYHIPRENKSGGGVGIFVKKIYKVSELNQHVFSSFEYINIKVTHLNKSIQITVAYRPPNTSKRVFLDEFGNFLDTQNDNRKILICEDFNLHMDNKTDNYVNEFTELLKSYDLENVINKPTSLSNHTINLVIQNKNEKVVHDIHIEPECVVSPMHKLILFNIKLWKSSTTKKWITYRNKINFEPEKFIDESLKTVRKLKFNCDCDLGRNQTDEQICVNCFTDRNKKILALNYKDRCPEVMKQIVVKENAKWYNSELRELKKQKRKLEDKWKRSKKKYIEENCLNYVVARNQ